jgi:hypothetical protein
MVDLLFWVSDTNSVPKFHPLGNLLRWASQSSLNAHPSPWQLSQMDVAAGVSGGLNHPQSADLFAALCASLRLVPNDGIRWFQRLLGCGSGF